MDTIQAPPCFILKTTFWPGRLLSPALCDPTVEKKHINGEKPWTLQPLSESIDVPEHSVVCSLLQRHRPSCSHPHRGPSFLLFHKIYHGKWALVISPFPPIKPWLRYLPPQRLFCSSASVIRPFCYSFMFKSIVRSFVAFSFSTVAASTCQRMPRTVIYYTRNKRISCLLRFLPHPLF